MRIQKLSKHIDGRCELIEKQTQVDISMDGQIMFMTQ